jgi:predicted AlkP superfamily pyrophosphatase or phosphodiesterase
VPGHAIDHVRKRYEATLKMSDRWLGRVLDVLDRHNLWEDTLVILTTDHGFMLGEKELLGKNYMPAYNEVYEIPLMVHSPGMTGQTRCDALTQNIDLFPTILESFGVEAQNLRNPIHGRNLLPLLQGETPPWRETVIYGMFGRQVNLCDGRYTYFRSAVRPDNTPLSVYTAMPSTINHYWDPEHLGDIRLIEAGRFLSWTEYPVFKIPNTITRLSDFSHDFKKRDEIVAHSLLFDLVTDPVQEHPLDDPAIEQEMCRKLRQAMEAHDSPEEQFERLGI